MQNINRPRGKENELMVTKGERKGFLVAQMVKNLLAM